MSYVVDRLVLELRAAKLPEPTTEYRFAPPRRWRFDLCWPGRMLAVEVEGGTWVRGRHSRGKGMRNDCAKYNAATLAGWTVLRVTSDMVNDRSAFAIVEHALRNYIGKFGLEVEEV